MGSKWTDGFELQECVLQQKRRASTEEHVLLREREYHTWLKDGYQVVRIVVVRSAGEATATRREVLVVRDRNLHTEVRVWIMNRKRTANSPEYQYEYLCHLPSYTPSTVHSAVDSMNTTSDIGVFRLCSSIGSSWKIER